MNKWLLRYIESIARFVSFFSKKYERRYQRWVFESQLELIQNRFPGDHWKASLDLMIAIGENVDPTIFLDDYHPTIGQRIMVSTGFKNVQHLWNWFDQTINSLQINSGVKDVHVKIALERMNFDFDSFLIMNNRSVKPRALYKQLTMRLTQLKMVIDDLPDNKRKTAYRRLSTVMPDLFSIQEALLSAALEV